MQHRGQERELLPHAVGELPHRLVHPVAQAQAPGQLRDPLARRAGIEGADRDEERQVLIGRQLLVERRLLGYVAHALLGRDRIRPQVDAGDVDGAGIGRLQAGGGADERALAGPVRAQEAHDLAGIHPERNRVQRLERAVAASDPRHLHHR